jgi:hypothetical protein
MKQKKTFEKRLRKSKINEGSNDHGKTSEYISNNTNNSGVAVPRCFNTKDVKYVVVKHSLSHLIKTQPVPSH